MVFVESAMRVPWGAMCDPIDVRVPPAPQHACLTGSRRSSHSGSSALRRARRGRLRRNTGGTRGRGREEDGGVDTRCGCPRAKKEVGRTKGAAGCTKRVPGGAREMNVEMGGGSERPGASVPEFFLGAVCLSSRVLWVFRSPGLRVLIRPRRAAQAAGAHAAATPSGDV